MKLKTGVLLVNLGTPDSPKTADVRKYLRQFLMDERVIDIQGWRRFFLVNFIIVPFKASRSAKEYKKLWTSKGSPLLFHSVELAEKLQQSLGEDYVVSLGMRYQSPCLKTAIEKLNDEKVSKIIVLPLFPQYASATTGSIFQEVMKILKNNLLIPKISFIDNFATNQEMIKTFAYLGQKYLDKENYDHILFSYHGLPERQHTKSNKNCLTPNCCDTYHKGNRLCYKAQCYETTRMLAKELKLNKSQFTNCFQSSLGNTKWIEPYTTDVISDSATKGIKKLLVFAPAFVSDCLETNIEIAQRYKEEFIVAGGEILTLVESLNSDPMWVKTVKNMILSN